MAGEFKTDFTTSVLYLRKRDPNINNLSAASTQTKVQYQKQ
jgi:hypothetical protein